jgi:prolyl-tRNA synthetase
VTPLALDSQTFPRVQTALDSSLKTSSSLFAVHAFASDTTVFLKGSDITTYLSSLETADVKVQEIDFVELKNEVSDPGATPKAAAKAAPKATLKDKDEGKIEGALQIGILYKKEVDFAGWYTDVRLGCFGECARC